MAYVLKSAEDRLQKTVFDFLSHQYPTVLAFAIPNGANKSKFDQWRFKVTGLRSGVPDIFIAHKSLKVPSNEVNDFYFGLFLELKSSKGKVSGEQKQWLYALEKSGYCAKVAYSLDEAISIIKGYLGGVAR